MIRLLIALWLLAVWVDSAAAFTITYYENTGTAVFTSPNTTANVTVSAVAGDIICPGATVLQSNRTMTFSDDGSSTYGTAVVSNEVANAIEAWSDCAKATTTVTTVTATVSSSIGGNSNVFAWVISGAHASTPFGNSSVGSEQTSSPPATTHDSGTVTITDGSAAYVGFSVHTGTGTFTADTDGWTTHKSIVGLITLSKENTVSENLNNTTGGDRTSVTLLREIRPAAAGVAAGSMLLLQGGGQ